jgi:hypothetical protein
MEMVRSMNAIRIRDEIAAGLPVGPGGSLAPEDQYLLDLEREASLSLMGEKKTQERMWYMLQNNKPLRN